MGIIIDNYRLTGRIKKWQIYLKIGACAVELNWCKENSQWTMNFTINWVKNLS